MPRPADIAGWAAVVRLKRETERYLRQVTAAMPEIARMARRHEQLQIDKLAWWSRRPGRSGAEKELGPSALMLHR